MLNKSVLQALNPGRALTVWARVGLQVEAKGRFAALAVWFGAMVAVSLFASEAGLIAGLIVLLVGGLATLGVHGGSGRRRLWMQSDRSRTS